jgi:hypothetical protein
MARKKQEEMVWAGSIDEKWKDTAILAFGVVVCLFI